MRIVDLFAGPGGWDQGLTDLGFDGTVVGLEWDRDACLTTNAAGHLRVQADVAEYPTDPFHGWDGLIASPPCQAFSTAGKGEGSKAIDQLLEHVLDCMDGWIDPPAELCAADVRADLSLQPLRWAWEMKPRWIACEQVPGVKPLWEAMAQVLWHWGFETSTAVLNAADYGVPQTRKRALLLARADGPVMWPEATHYDSRKSMGLFGLPWVSMADALGWGSVDPAPAQCGNGQFAADKKTRARLQANRATGTRWVEPGDVVRTGANTMKHSRRTEDIVPYERSVSEPAPTVDAKAGSAWTLVRPATTVCADPRIAEPGWRGKPSDYDADGNYHGDRSMDRAIKVTIQQAGVLQSFAPDYPWHGNKGSQFRQCGNAVPPRLAAVVLRRLVTTKP